MKSRKVEDSMERLLIVNSGSTSTKIAVYEDEKQVFQENVSHDTEKLKEFATVADQNEFRKDLILSVLGKHGFSMNAFTGIVARGGALPPIKSGAYKVNEDMIWQLKYAPDHEHASSLAALIAYEIASANGIPAFIYDAVAVDEMPPQLKLTGFPELERRGTGHNLNARAAARRYAKDHNKEYRDYTLIVAHLGGGFSISLHQGGKIIDMINDEDGSFTPERAGALPIAPLIHMIFSGGYDEKSIMKKIKGQGGLVAHLGVNDSRKVEEMIIAGDAHAKMVYEAMALNVAKNIAREFPIVKGEVDAVLLTGGIAHSEMFTGMIRDRLNYIAPPVLVYAGENEMEALALGGLRVLRGEETAADYVKVEK
ncbi:MAG: butyrate kinase [Synergistaceae bacterium]|jgi:butyrate kinase|nr:butyrate kinase [Synergistaceae bacterium]